MENSGEPELTCPSCSALRGEGGRIGGGGGGDSDGCHKMGDVLFLSIPIDWLLASGNEVGSSGGVGGPRCNKLFHETVLFSFIIIGGAGSSGNTISGLFVMRKAREGRVRSCSFLSKKLIYHRQLSVAHSHISKWVSRVRANAPAVLSIRSFLSSVDFVDCWTRSLITSFPLTKIQNILPVSTSNEWYVAVCLIDHGELSWFDSSADFKA